MFNLNLNSTSLILAEKSDWEKNAYHLGAYDTINGNTITRQTGYIDLSTIGDWGLYQDTSGYDIWYFHHPFEKNQYYDSNVAANCKHGIYVATTYSNPSMMSNNRVSYSGSTIIIRTTSTDIYPRGILQFKLKYSYDETIISDRSINNLDQQGSRWVNELYENSLNLLPDSNNKTLSGDNYYHYYFKRAGIYTISFTGSTTGSLVVVLQSAGGTERNVYPTSIQTGLLQATFPVYTGDQLQRFYSSQSFTTNIMLNEGQLHPYQPYYGPLVRASNFQNGVLTLVS